MVGRMPQTSRWAIWLGILTLVITGCASPSPSTSRDAAQPTAVGARTTDRTKSITVGITSTVPAMSIVTFGTPAGGWSSLTEVHSEGLVTSDANSRAPVGRLAERVPSLADGSITMLPDGKMRVVFNLRKGVTWQDGTPFTADDLVFSYRIGGPEGIPQYLNGAVPYISTVEAPDPSTFVVTYRAPYFQGAVLGPFLLWPLPQHLLGEAYQRFLTTKNPDEVLNSPYWTSGYVHLGPFRLTQFDPGNELIFQAYDGYFLGPPRIGTIRVRIFSDETTLFSNLVAGTVDLSPDLALRDAAGPQLKRMWDASGDGTVYTVEGALRRYDPQRRSELMAEPTVADPRVRIALLQALDREVISEGVNGGNPQMAAWSILSRGDPLYDATRDGLRVYGYSPDRARALLQEAGWVTGSDGSLRHSTDGRPFRTAIYVSIGNENDGAASASYWRQLGIQVDEHVWTAAETRDNRARAQYPGWDGTGGSMLNPMGQAAATAETNWAGNRGGFEDPAAQQLVRAFRGSVDPAEQVQAMRRINEYAVAELPALPLYFIAIYVGARKGVRAFTADDVAGFMQDNPLIYGYGTLSRHASQWDVQ
jgi:peptide/nickel transport system substrate-binding protein